MSTFLNNSKSDPSRSRASPVSDNPPFDEAVKGVLNLATKLDQMSKVKPDPNYVEGTDVLKQCASTMMEFYNSKPKNDENLDDSKCDPGFARQFMG